MMMASIAPMLTCATADFLSAGHNSPSYPGKQRQTNPLGKSTHSPCMHGSSKHSLMLTQISGEGTRRWPAGHLDIWT